MAEQRRVTIKDVRPGGREVLRVTWPGGREVNMLLLRYADLQEAHFAAVERFRKQDQPMDTLTTIEVFGRERDLQEVYRMILQPDSKLPKDRLFKSADDARTEMGLDEIAWFTEKHSELTRASLAERGFEIVVKDAPRSPDSSD